MAPASRERPATFCHRDRLAPLLTARYACRGSTRWKGYLAHVIETCDNAGVNIITDVTTTAAPARPERWRLHLRRPAGPRGQLARDHSGRTGQGEEQTSSAGARRTGAARVTSWRR